ncbi:MAG: TIM barrel protein [Planctomycetia bacterium]|nr:TIM barrel protein [Planctomycetia bacterium]
MSRLERRDFLKRTALLSAALAAGPLGERLAWGADPRGSKMKLGLVTYQWAKDWDVATILHHLEASGVLGIEPRTTHAHGIEPSLNAQQRGEIKRRFDDSPVKLVGLGSNECYDDPDPAVLAKAIEATKAFVKLGHDVGAGGVKVKPNGFHKDVPREKTIEQIGRSLNTVGKFAADCGQQIRLEVHGECSPPPVMKQIMDVADHPNVTICWNSNRADQEGLGLEANFNLLKDRFGATCHIRTLDDGGYPFQKLLDLMAKMDYDGWLLMECSTPAPKDPVAELTRQRVLFEKMRSIASAGV